MRIAVPYEDGQIFQHFGHTETFKVYDLKDKEIMSTCFVDTQGSGHGALSHLLQGMDADVLICGGIGGGAQMALNQAGIRFYGGVSGSCDEAVQAFLKGKLAYDPDFQCTHHGEHHGEDHSCGDSCCSHSCGED